MLGSKIANCKGVPGTAGCVAYRRCDNQPVLLSSWHVLYGKGAAKGDKIWLVNERNNRNSLFEVGRVQAGRIGKVWFHNWEVYVDCAISSWTVGNGISERYLSTSIGNRAVPEITGHCEGHVGDTVMKVGSSTGITDGVVIDDRYAGKASIEGKTFHVEGQLVIRSDNEKPFSNQGDSGAIIINKDNKAVGLLWGTNHQGQGLACPIAPVLSILDIDIGRIE